MIGAGVGVVMALAMLIMFIVTGEPSAAVSMVFCLACAGLCVAVDR